MKHKKLLSKIIEEKKLPFRGIEPAFTMTLCKRSSVRLFALTISYSLYLIIGAAIFAAVEGPAEMELKKELSGVREQFLEDHKDCLTGKSYVHVIFKYTLHCVYCRY